MIAIGGGALLDMVGLAAAHSSSGCASHSYSDDDLESGRFGRGCQKRHQCLREEEFCWNIRPSAFAVINDAAWLLGLSERDKRGGYAEAVKVALIRDASFFEALEAEAHALAQFDLPAMESLIYRCAELHMDHIAQGGDPFEFGSARP